MIPHTAQVSCTGEFRRYYKTFPRSDGFFIGTFEAIDPSYETITVQGHAEFHVNPGEYLDLVMDYAGQDKYKPSVPSYKITSMRRWFEDRLAFEHYLKSPRCRNYDMKDPDNKTTTEMAWNAFKTNVVRQAHDDPDGFRAALSACPDAANRLIAALTHRNADAQLKSLLPGVGATMLKRLVAKYHADAPAIIKADPYVMLWDFPDEPGFTFPRVDAWARSLGVKQDNRSRLQAGVRCAVRDLLKDGDYMTGTGGGHACVPCNDPGWFGLIWSRLSTYLGPGMDQKAVMDVMRDGSAGLTLRDFDNQVWLYDSELLDKEITAAAILKRLSAAQPVPGLNAKEVREGIQDYTKKYGVVPTPSQMMVVMNSLTNRVSIVTGGPGSGKTSAMAALIYVWTKYAEAHNYDPSVILVAPTGMAVRNLLSAAQGLNLKDLRPRYGTVASCIIGLKNQNPERRRKTLEQFNKGVRSLVILDETSMLGLSDLAAFLRLVPEAQIVFVGDPDQLPSVESGDAFQSLILSGAIKSQALSGNNRVAKTAMALARNADRIKSGLKLSDMEIDPGVFETRPHASESDAMFADACDEYMAALNAGQDKKEIAVLSPTRAAVGHMNRLLQDMVNPVPAIAAPKQDMLHWVTGMTYDAPGMAVPYLKAYDDFSKKAYNMRVGDRVVVTKNLELVSGSKIVNGDRGVLEKFFMPDDKDDHPIAFLRLDGRKDTIELQGDDSEDDPLSCFMLSYATTVHKAQGCEFDDVILILGGRLASRNPGFSNRNLLYTAATRARRRLVTVGSEKAFDNMAATPRPLRWSLLDRRVAGLC